MSKISTHAYLVMGFVPTQELNQGLLHCRWILYQLSHQGSPGSGRSPGEGIGYPLQYSWASLVGEALVGFLGFDSWVGKIPWRRERLPPPVFLPGESHGQRSLAGCRSWGHTELDMTEQLSRHAHLFLSPESRGRVLTALMALHAQSSLLQPCPPTPLGSGVVLCPLCLLVTPQSPD